MLRRVTLVRTDVSEELSASFIRVTRISELGTTLAVTTNRRKQRASVANYVVPSSPIIFSLKMAALCSSETSIFTRTPHRNNPEDGILHSHRHEHLKFYIPLTGWALQRRSTVLNRVFWDVTSCGSCKNRRSSESSVLTRATRSNIPEDAIFHSHHRENLKFYIRVNSFVKLGTNIIRLETTLT
jgi:hypothetical protein